MNICIAHLRHAYSGGAERYLNYLAQGLCERGHDVTIACRSHAEAPHPNVEFALLRKFAIGSAWRHWAFARSLEQFIARDKTRFDAVFALGRTWSQDIVRVSGGCHQTWVNNLPGTEQASGLPYKDRVKLRLEARSFAPGAYRKVICNSDMVRRDVIRRHAVPEHAIEVIYNGVDLERFNPRHRDTVGAEIRREAGFSKDNVVFVFLGTGFERKGLDIALRAFAQAAHDHTEMRLLIAGRDSTSAIYEQLSRELQIDNQVVFLGERLDAQACLTAGDVLVLPTRYDPFANVTIEALACGLPVITSDTNGGSEIMPSEAVGTVLSMDENIIANLAQAMREWNDPGRIEKASLAARSVAEQHGIDNKLDAAIKLIEEVVLERKNET